MLSHDLMGLTKSHYIFKFRILWNNITKLVHHSVNNFESWTLCMKSVDNPTREMML